MSHKKSVSIELIKGTVTDYIIKDAAGITSGRFNILELDRENRKATIRLKFYRNDNYLMLKEAIEIILNAILKEKYLYKVNIMIAEDTNIGAFMDLGFILEGILSDNIFTNEYHKSELIFGVNVCDYKIHQNISLIKLKGANIELRNLTPEHAKEMLQYYIANQEHLRCFEPVREKSFYTYETQYNILMESYRQFIDGTSLDFGIFKDNKIIGKVKLSNIVLGVFKSGILGYSIDREYQGKGYMKEAVSIVMDYAFYEAGLHRIEASTLVDNLKSQKVLESCGFEKLGLNKKYLFINGEWRDHITFYKLNNKL